MLDEIIKTNLNKGSEGVINIFLACCEFKNNNEKYYYYNVENAIWENTYFDADVFKLIKRVVFPKLKEFAKQYPEYKKQCFQLEFLFRDIRSLQTKTYDPNFVLNPQQNVLPLKDGTIVNLATLEVRQRTSADYWDFCSAGSLCLDTTIAEKYILEICNNDEQMAEELKCWMGYVLTTCTNSYKFAIIVGSGCNSKSRFLRILRNVMNLLYERVGYEQQPIDESVRLVEISENVKLSTQYLENVCCEIVKHKFVYMTNKFDETMLNERLKKYVKIFYFNRVFESSDEYCQYIEDLETVYIDQFVTLAVKYANKHILKAYEPGGYIYNKCEEKILQ